MWSRTVGSALITVLVGVCLGGETCVGVILVNWVGRGAFCDWGVCGGRFCDVNGIDDWIGLSGTVPYFPFIGRPRFRGLESPREKCLVSTQNLSFCMRLRREDVVKMRFGPPRGRKKQVWSDRLTYHLLHPGLPSAARCSHLASDCA